MTVDTKTKMAGNVSHMGAALHPGMSLKAKLYVLLSIAVLFIAIIPAKYVSGIFEQDTTVFILALIGFMALLESLVWCCLNVPTEVYDAFMSSRRQSELPDADFAESPQLAQEDVPALLIPEDKAVDDNQEEMKEKEEIEETQSTDEPVSVPEISECQQEDAETESVSVEDAPESREEVKDEENEEQTGQQEQAGQKEQEEQEEPDITSAYLDVYKRGCDDYFNKMAYAKKHQLAVISEYIHYIMAPFVPQDSMEELCHEIMTYATDPNYTPKPYIGLKDTLTRLDVSHLIWNITIRLGLGKGKPYSTEKNIDFIRAMFPDLCKNIDRSTMKNMRNAPESGNIHIDAPGRDGLAFRALSNKDKK